MQVQNNNNIIMEEVLEVDENEIKEVLESHSEKIIVLQTKTNIHEEKIYGLDNKIINHSEKLHELELKDIAYESRFNNLDTTLARVENTTLQNLQTSNLLINTISQIAIGNSAGNTEIKKQEILSDTEIKKIKLNNNLSMALKIIGIVSLLITSFVAVKYGITIK